jgi:hypothetical protein
MHPDLSLKSGCDRMNLGGTVAQSGDIGGEFADVAR